jgi:integrase/recombinase XerC
MNKAKVESRKSEGEQSQEVVRMGGLGDIIHFQKGDFGSPSFEGWLRDSSRAEKTVRSYLADFGQFAKWFALENNTGFDPQLVTSWDLRGWYRYSRTVQRVAASTWNRRRAMLALFAEYLQLQELVNYNIFQDIPTAAEEELAPRSLEKKEYGQFMRMVEVQISAARTTSQRTNALRDAAMVALMVYCGLRVEEVVNLNRDDIQLNERSGVVMVRNGKGGKAGKVPLGLEVRRWLRDYEEVYEGNEILFGGLSTRQVERRVKEIGRLAGVMVTPHMLRHTCATRMVQKGVALTVVQKVLRHSRLDVTARYTKPSWGDLEEAVDSL